MSAPFRPNRISVRIAAGLGAVVVALGLVGAQLRLADHYAGQAERAAPAASAATRLADAHLQGRHAVRRPGG